MGICKKIDLKTIVGILISLLCIYLAFRNVDFHEMGLAFNTANYWYILPAILTIFFSHYLRALRWRYLLDPIRRLDVGSLFSSLIIGYGANTFMPAHLGEVVRAYVVSKKRQIPMSPVFATIVVERIIDVLSLLVLLVVALFIYPFPEWVIKSGYIMLAGTVGLFLFLIFLKTATAFTISIIGIFLKPFPDRFGSRIKVMLTGFVAGILPLEHWHNYITTGILSFVIWICYGLVFLLCLYSFNFMETYHLNWIAALILLVITTIAVAVPSSPGYVGIYHYLCQVTLALFSVPAGPALSFAAVVHGVNFLPVLIVGFFLAQREGTAIFKMSTKVSKVEPTATHEVV